MNRIIVLLSLLVYTATASAQSDPTQKFILDADPGWNDRWERTDRVWPSVHGEADVCVWADDKMAAVSFTVDDNICPDHDWWIDKMDRYGWKMTWFVIVQYIQDGGNAYFGSNWEPFRRLVDLGHDVESHTMTHGHCNDPEYSFGISCPAVLTGGSCCDVDWEYREARDIINDSLPGYECLTIAYSGHSVYDRTATVAGTTFTYDSYAHDFSVAAEYYIAGRSTIGRPSIVHRTYYPNTNAGGISREWIDNVIDYNPSEQHYWRGWISPLYHALPDTAELATQLAYIKSREDDLWVDTYKNCAKYGQSRDTHTLTVTSVADDEIRFTVTDSMADSIYTHPLTVKVRLRDGWGTDVAAVQNGGAVEAALITHEGGIYALVKAVPDAGEVTVTNATSAVGPVRAHAYPFHLLLKGVMPAGALQGVVQRHGLGLYAVNGTPVTGTVTAGTYLVGAPGNLHRVVAVR